jgi:phage repressor protein C with HTH and peptisase S24 domain
MFGTGSRLRQLMEDLQLKSVAKLSRITGVARQTLSAAIKADSLSPETAYQVGKALNIRPEWIVFGTGSRTNEDPEGEADHASTSAKKFAFVKRAKQLLSTSGAIEADERYDDSPVAFRVDYLESREIHPDRALVAVIEGDSMVPTFNHGDMVLIDLLRAELTAGKIYAIGLGNLVHIRRLQWVPEGLVRVIADNDLYSDFDMLQEDTRILGEIRWVGRDIN